MKTSNRKKTLRTRFLIFPQFQLRLLGANLAVIVVIAAVVWFQMTSSFAELEHAAGISGVEAEFYRKYLAFHSHQLNVALGLSFVTAAIASAAMTLVLSHRFSGPLVRLRGYFRQLTEQPQRDPIPHLSFRRNDFLGDIPPLVNQALDRIQRESSDGHGPKRRSA
jgi:hypothetical protein